MMRVAAGLAAFLSSLALLGPGSAGGGEPTHEEYRFHDGVACWALVPGVAFVSPCGAANAAVFEIATGPGHVLTHVVAVAEALPHGLALYAFTYRWCLEGLCEPYETCGSPCRIERSFEDPGPARATHHDLGVRHQMAAQPFVYAARDICYVVAVFYNGHAVPPGYDPAPCG